MFVLRGTPGGKNGNKLEQTRLGETKLGQAKLGETKLGETKLNNRVFMSTVSGVWNAQTVKQNTLQITTLNKLTLLVRHDPDNACEIVKKLGKTLATIALRTDNLDVKGCTYVLFAHCTTEVKNAQMLIEVVPFLTVTFVKTYALVICNLVANVLPHLSDYSEWLPVIEQVCNSMDDGVGLSLNIKKIFHSVTRMCVNSSVVRMHLYKQNFPTKWLHYLGHVDEEIVRLAISIYATFFYHFKKGDTWPIEVGTRVMARLANAKAESLFAKGDQLLSSSFGPLLGDGWMWDFAVGWSHERRKKMPQTLKVVQDNLLMRMYMKTAGADDLQKLLACGTQIGISDEHIHRVGIILKDMRKRERDMEGVDMLLCAAEIKRDKIARTHVS